MLLRAGRQHMNLLDPQLFPAVKALHLATIAITVAGFILRGIWMIRGSAYLNTRAARTLPHINDTLLLVSAIWAAALLGQYPFVDDWLTAKVFGAIAYILLGSIALTYGKSRRIRAAAFASALICFGYVVAVALTKNPLLI